MHISGTDLFIAALVLGYIVARWQLHLHLKSKRRAR
jgi:hypothetical protein